MGKEKIHTLVMANWGLGEKILECVHKRDDVSIRKVITHFDGKQTEDPWYNCVHARGVALGLAIENEIGMDLTRLKQLFSDNIDLAIMHSHMRILPEAIFSLPTFGTINIHPSLLPRHRGPDPTAAVLARGDGETGLTCHYLDRGVDSGNVLAQRRIPVKSGDDRISIIERLKTVVHDLMRESLERVFQGSPGAPQPR